MDDKRTISRIEYQGPYREKIRQRLEASRREPGAASFEELRALYESLSGLSADLETEPQLCSDRLRLGARLMHAEFAEWRTGLMQTAQTQSEKTAAIKQLEAETAKLAGEIQALEQKINDSQYGVYNQYIALIEKHNAKIAERKALAAEIYFQRHDPADRLKEAQRYAGDCKTCLIALAKSGWLAAEEFDAIKEELSASIAAILSLPKDAKGIDAHEAYRELMQAAAQLQKALAMAAPRASGENLQNATAETAESPVPEAAPPDDVETLINEIKNCESEEAKAAVWDKLHRICERLKAALRGEAAASATALAAFLLANAWKFRLALLRWQLELKTLRQNENEYFTKQEDFKNALLALQQKIEANREKLDSPNYTLMSKRNFQQAIDKFTKDGKRKQEELAALKNQLAERVEPHFARLAACHDILLDCQTWIGKLTGAAERQRTVEEIGAAINEIGLLERRVEELIGGGELLKNHFAYQALAETARKLTASLQAVQPDLNLTLPEATPAAEAEAGMIAAPAKENILETVAALRSKLKERLSGHAIAYKQLLTGEKPFALKQLYHPLAEKEWRKISAENPGDWVACHHLAILYHAKAFDLEMEGRDAEAEAAWKEALTYWQKLVELQEPINSIHGWLKNMERYKDDHDSELLALKAKVLHDLLLVHVRWYEHYVSLKQPDKAERHYSILERLPLNEAQEMLKRLYEKNYGGKVASLLNQLKAKKDDRGKREFAAEVDRLYETVKTQAKKRTSLIPAHRDLALLSAARFQVRFSEWHVGMNELIDSQANRLRELERLGEELERLRSQIQQLEFELQRGNHAQSRLYQDLVDKHNEKLRRARQLEAELNGERRRHIQTLEELTVYLDEADAPTEKLISSNDAAAKQAVGMELQGTVSTVLLEMNGFKEHQAYRALEGKSTKLQNKIKALRSEALTAAPAPFKMNTDGGIWNWVEFKRKENPYANTAFLILETALPALQEKHDIKNLLTEMKQKKLLLERKVRADQHVVLGHKISRENLNAVLQKLDSPAALAKDMMLQHQAHDMDTEDLQAQLGAIPLPSPEAVPVALSRGVFSLFSLPVLPEAAQLRWKKPETKLPQEKTKPQIKWPS